MLYVNHFRFYLARQADFSFRAVNDTVANVRRVERAFDTDLGSLLTQLEPAALAARISASDALFAGQNPNSLANCRVAVNHYREFEQWRLAQQQS